MFIDEVILTFKAGKGGDGSKSFLHLPHNPMGGPDGGDGGRGGSISVIGDNNLDSLQTFNHIREIKAHNGDDGQKKKMHGKNAEDLFIKVPLGTSISEINSSNGREFTLFEVTDTKEYLVVKGGRGGWGNVHFTSSTNQAPDYAVPGQAGELKEIKLNLQMIADVGLVGLPNAGKSTLLSVVSDAKPKIADYAFTTLEPHLGVVKGNTRNFIVADLPGLIEGASAGKGLGQKFLKHIEKTKMIVHLIDSNSETIDTDYVTIRRELEQFSQTLRDKPELIVFSKVDAGEDHQPFVTNVKPAITISAATHYHIPELIKLLEKNLT